MEFCVEPCLEDQPWNENKDACWGPAVVVVGLGFGVAAGFGIGVATVLGDGVAIGLCIPSSENCLPVLPG